jgi:tetratricopeptide (TPR) repeat protein
MLAIAGMTLTAIQHSAAMPVSSDRQDGEALAVTTSSEAARQHFEAAMALYENVRVEDALKEWREAVHADPEFALGHAWICFNTTIPEEEARERAKVKSLAGSVTPGEQLLIRWIVDIKENNYVGGISAMNDLLAKYPRDKRLCYVMATWLYHQRAHEAARKLLAQALEEDPNYGAAFNQAGYVDAELGAYGKAVEELERYAQLFPQEPNPEDSLGEILRRAGKFDLALVHYRKGLALDPVFCLLGVADTLALMDDQGAARAAYIRAIDTAPTDSEKIDYTLRLALTYVREKRYEEADKAFSEGAAKAHAAKQWVWEAAAHRMMAMYQPRFARAMKQLDQAEAVLAGRQDVAQSSRDREMALILGTRARIAADAGDARSASESITALEKMAAAFGGNDEIQFSYHAAKAALLMSQQKYRDAIPELQEAYNDPFSLKLLFVAYTKIGDKRYAAEVRDKLLTCNLVTIEQALVVPQFRKQQRASSDAHE